MMHLTVGGKSLLSGDRVTDLLVEYAARLGRRGSADDVRLRAIGPDGSEVTATILVNDGLALVAETTSSSAPEPDNAELERYLQVHIDRLRGLEPGDPEDVAGGAIWNRGSSDPAAS